MIRHLILPILLIVSIPTSRAWDKADLKKEITSPWSHHVNNVFWTGTALTLLTLAVRDGYDDFEGRVAKDRPLGSLSEFGDLAGKMYPNAIYLVGQLAAAGFGNENGIKRAIGMAKATAYSSLLTQGLKQIVREPRPDGSGDKDSFPSAHSTHAFAFGGYVYAQHGWQWGIPALAVSAFSAASRINDNRHRLHDVFAGATIGLSYGLGIGWLDRKQDDEDETSITFAPLYEGDLKGIVLIGEF